MQFLSKDKLLALSAFLLLVLGISGCAPKTTDFKRASKINSIMDSWVGHYQSELIAHWGTPTKIESDGKGGKIITYESLKGTWGREKDKHIVGGGHYQTKPKQPGYAATRIFYVNEHGIIYSWKWSGL
jgi:hypothetical protein